MTSWRTILSCAATAAILGAASVSAGDSDMLENSAGNRFIWIEGEDAVGQNMQRHGWYDSVKKENLSGGEWLSHFAGGTPPVARYEFSVGAAGDYHFWIRANSVAGPRLRYRLGGGDWTEVDLSRAVENVNIASDGKPDMRFISWVNAGQVRLGRGKQQIAFQFYSPNNNHGAIDCFVLTQRPFLPRGALKPGERTDRANAGFFPWEPEVDAFTDGAVVDLRYLNEDVAGAHGRVAAEGNGFVLGDGTPVKFRTMETWLIPVHHGDADRKAYFERLVERFQAMVDGYTTLIQALRNKYEPVARPNDPAPQAANADRQQTPPPPKRTSVQKKDESKK